MGPEIVDRSSESARGARDSNSSSRMSWWALRMLKILNPVGSPSQKEGALMLLVDGDELNCMGLGLEESMKELAFKQKLGAIGSATGASMTSADLAKSKTSSSMDHLLLKNWGRNPK